MTSLNYCIVHTLYYYIVYICRGSDQFYTVTYYIKWVTTSWTYSINLPLNTLSVSFSTSSGSKPWYDESGSGSKIRRYKMGYFFLDILYRNVQEVKELSILNKNLLLSVRAVVTHFIK